MVIVQTYPKLLVSGAFCLVVLFKMNDQTLIHNFFFIGKDDSPKKIKLAKEGLF